MKRAVLPKAKLEILKRAVDWIAENDEPTSLDAGKVAELISVQLIADVLAIPADAVAACVVDRRTGLERLDLRSRAVHYGTANGPACGSRFAHDGLTAIGDVGLVTCDRCKRSLAFRKDAGLGILS